MACITYTTPMNVWTATDAGFRIWGKAWTDIIDLMGFEQVYSNIDWATAIMPTGSTTYAGKRIYRFNDALSANREIYFSVEFGRGSTSSATYGFAIRLGVGTHHDGTGVLTNFSFNNYLTQIQSPPDGGEIVGVRSHLGFSIFTNLNSGAYSQAGFAIERLAENTVPSVDGVVCMLTGASVNTASSLTSSVFQTANYAGANVFAAVGGQGSANSDLAFANIQSIPHTSDPSYAAKAPAMTMATFGKYDPCYHWLFTSRYMYSAASEFFATINGVDGLFRIPVTGFYGDNGSTSYMVARLAMRVS